MHFIMFVILLSTDHVFSPSSSPPNDVIRCFKRWLNNCLVLKINSLQKFISVIVPLRSQLISIFSGKQMELVVYLITIGHSIHSLFGLILLSLKPLPCPEIPPANPTVFSFILSFTSQLISPV